jgi:osmotically-inducible protein OsmY
MTTVADTISRVREALRMDPRVHPAYGAMHLEMSGDDLVMEGEVPTVAVKKLALERAAAVPGVAHIVDRLRVAAAERMMDGQIRDLVRDALIQEPALADCSLYEWAKGKREAVRITDPSRGTIDIRVEDGVVTLDGDVPGLGRKRIAGVLAWWVPGSRDVVNGLGVTPPEEDTAFEIADAVRIALEKDRFVDASQIRVSVQDAVVTLTGIVPTESERDMAEFDAWYVFGVDKVVNRIEVRA